MPYDEKLAGRVRELLSGQTPLSEKKMFGGLAFMVRGNMCCGVVEATLMVRVGPDRYEEALARRYARPMDFTGRPLRGFVYVDPEGIRAKRDLKRWVDLAVSFVTSLPEK
jgi:TfoX/Sxy family transcriptional regulator of competence genes